MENIFQVFRSLQAHIFTFFLKRSFHSFGKNSFIVPPFRFKNLKNIQIGKNVLIETGSWIQVVGEKTNKIKLIIEDNVEIGMNTTISVTKYINIQNHVMFARNVYISDHSHKYQDIRIPISAQGINALADVIIGEGSWLGQNSIILPGVRIGKNCVIGANSVVNKSIGDFSVAAGIPAKIIKKHDTATGKWEKST